MCDSCLAGLQDLDEATLFVLLKTRKGLLTADAVLVCPVKLADVDAKVIGGTPFPSLSMKHLRAQREAPSVNAAISPVFNEEEVRKAPARLRKRSYHTTVVAEA